MGSRSRKRPSEGDVAHENEREIESPTLERKKSRHGGDSDENDDENKENHESNHSSNNIPVDVASLMRRRINAPGKPPEAGVIQRVYVENFMCHRKLKVDLCRNVNFIHGQNGSGKSAILAAIQICLGAGARRTHRARNLKDLIRKEATTGAKVRVTLLNKGGDGYQREIYGDTITVERTISKSGGYNGYKLLDHEGKERSRKKQDLVTMLDHLNIQVENPVAVMDQEASKKFLTGKPQDKYAFFCKATELERLRNATDSIVNNITEAENSNDRVKLSLKSSLENVNRLKKELDQFEELDKLEEKILNCQVDYAWAFYNDCDNLFLQEQEKVQTLEQKCRKRRKDLVATEEEASNQGKDEEQEKRARMDGLTEEAEAAASSKKDLEAELKRATAPIKAKERELQNLGREQKKAVQRLTAAKRYLQETRDQILEAAGSVKSEEARRTQKLQQAEEELEEANAESLQIRQEISLNLRKYEDLEPHVQQAKQNVATLASQVSAVKHKIRDLESSESSSLAMFGRKCEQVHKLVERAHKKRQFRGKVVGPIGAHIKVAPGKEQYAQIAELAIGGGTLDRFIVTNDEDRRLFMKIRRDAGCNSHECNVFQMADVARYRVPAPPARDVETVASTLQVADDLVFNTLVDHCRIDQRALAGSKEVSERALLVEGANHTYSIRGNVQQVYFLPLGDHWTVNKKGSRSTVSNERQLRQTIGVDKSHAVENAQQEVAALSKDLEESRAKEADLAKQHKEYKVKWNNANKANRKNGKRVEALRNTIEEVRAEADATEETNALDTTELEEDVEKANNEAQALQEQREEMEQEIEEMKPAVAEIEGRLEEVAARNEKVLADMEEAEQELQQFYQSLSQRRELVDKKKAKLEQVEALLRKHQDGLEKISQDRDTSLRKARTLDYRMDLAKKKKEERSQDEDVDMSLTSSQDEMTSDPPDEVLEQIEPKRTRKEPSHYRARIESTKKRIAKERERRSLTNVDQDVLREQYMRAKNDVDSKLKEIDTIDENVRLLTADTKRRQRLQKQFRTHVDRMTNIAFDEMLQLKGSSGSLAFEHEERKLDIKVQKDNMNDMSQTSDVKALSGGERSFATLALLLALGEQLETPFRVMDEFDVFMDPFSRKLALQQLVDVSKAMEHRQFIYITPQDLSFLRADPMLSIIKMKPPARSVHVGGPTQQTL